MYLAFDVGGTFVKYAIMTEDGEIIEKNKIPTRNKDGDGIEEFLDSLVDIYVQYRSKVPMFGIAISLPGQVDVKKGIVYGGGMLPFLDKVNVVAALSAKCGNIPVSIENDARCAALAELWQGNAKDKDDVCVMVMGTGVGGGIILKRHVHRGKRLVAGELSFVIDQMTRQQLDYVETWVDQEEHNWLDLGFSPLISGSCATRFGLVANVAKAKNLSFDEVSGEQIYEWARQGDEICINALEDLYYAIAKECSRLYITLDPDVILIGGGISSEPAYVEGINRYADKIKHIFPIYEGMQIKPCKFRNDSNLIGALFNFLQIHNLVD